MRSSLLIASAAIFATSCQNMPEPYAPPVQRQPFEDAKPHRAAQIVSMNDGDAGSHVVQDIPLVEAAPWRWVLQKPTVKVSLRSNQGLRYIIDFSLPPVTFTGPVMMTFLVNDHVLETKRYEASGEYHFEKPVPPEWVEPMKETRLAAWTDKVWVAPKDGARLGFILVRIGLTQ